MQSIPLTKKNSLLSLALATALLLVPAAFTANKSVVEGKEPAVSLLKPGQKAPSNVLMDINGNNVIFPTENKWNLVFYWSLFCHSCIEEMPELHERLAELKGDDLCTYFVSLDTDQMQKALKNFVKRRKFTKTILMEQLRGEKYVTADTWGVVMTPTVFIVDPNGKIVFSNQGPLDIDLFFKNLPEAIARPAVGAGK